MKRWGVIGAIVLLAAISGAAYMAGASATPVRTAKVSRGEIREYIDEQGKTRLPHTHLISMPFGGRIEPIELVEGQEVSASQVVAQMVAADLCDDVAEAQAAVEQLEAAIAENRDISVEQLARTQAEKLQESMADTVQAADARKEAAEERLKYATRSFDRIRKLFGNDATTEDDLDRAELARVESEIECRQNVLVWEALKSVKVATDLLPRMVGDIISRKSLKRAVLEKQKQEAEARLRQALTNQQRGTMRSPVDGVVLQRLVSNERFLPAGAELLEIGRLEELEVEADILSQDAVRIRVGDEAEIYGPAVAASIGRGLRSVVRRIYPAGFTKISSLGVEQQRVKVILRFADQAPAGGAGTADAEKLMSDLGIGVGYRVRVRIFPRARTNENALILPRSALFRGEDGGWQTFVVRDGRALLQPVEVGLMNDEMCEVREGLREGDLVILTPENSLEPGDRVRPTSPQ